MKSFRLMFILVFLSVSSIAAASDRQILLMQQKVHGHLIYVSLVEADDKVVLSVVGMGASTIKKEQMLSLLEFNRLWEMANSEPVMKHVLPEGTETNMADPNYYTVAVRSPTKNLRIQLPIAGEAGAVNEFIDNFTKFIPAKD